MQPLLSPAGFGQVSSVALFSPIKVIFHTISIYFFLHWSYIYARLFLAYLLWCVAPQSWCLYPLCIPHRCNKILFTLKHEFWYVQEKFKVYMRNFICCMTTSSLSLRTYVPHNHPLSVTHQALNRRLGWVTAVSALIMQQIPGLFQSYKSQRKSYGGKSRKLVNMLYHKPIALNCK